MIKIDQDRVEIDPEGVFLKNLASEIATYEPKWPKQQICPEIWSVDLLPYADTKETAPYKQWLRRAAFTPRDIATSCRRQRVEH